MSSTIQPDTQNGNQAPAPTSNNRAANGHNGNNADVHGNGSNGATQNGRQEIVSISSNRAVNGYNSSAESQGSGSNGSTQHSSQGSGSAARGRAMNGYNNGNAIGSQPHARRRGDTRIMEGADHFLHNQEDFRTVLPLRRHRGLYFSDTDDSALFTGNGTNNNDDDNDSNSSIASWPLTIENQQQANIRFSLAIENDREILAHLDEILTQIAERQLEIADLRAEYTEVQEMGAGVFFTAPLPSVRRRHSYPPRRVRRRLL